METETRELKMPQNRRFKVRFGDGKLGYFWTDLTWFAKMVNEMRHETEYGFNGEVIVRVYSEHLHDWYGEYFFVNDSAEWDDAFDFIAQNKSIRKVWVYTQNKIDLDAMYKEYISKYGTGELGEAL